MAEPTTPAAPFNPRAAQVPGDGPGCSKPLLVGCGVLLLLLGLGAVLFIVEAPSIVRWWFHKLESTIAPRLPADLAPAERQRLHQAFEAAGRAASSGKSDLPSMQPFQRKIMALADPQARVTRKDVKDLIDSLEAISRRSPPSRLEPRPPSLAPAPEPPPPPGPRPPQPSSPRA